MDNSTYFGTKIGMANEPKTTHPPAFQCQQNPKVGFCGARMSRGEQKNGLTFY